MTVGCHIAIDAVGAKHSGAATVLQAVVGAALENQAVGRLTVFCSSAARRAFSLPDDEKLLVVDVPLGERGIAGRACWQHVSLRAATRAAKAQVLLCLSGGGLGPRHLPTIQLIQQSLPFSREALSTLGVLDYLRARTLGWNMRVSAVRSAGVAVQTETMKQQVVDRFGLDSSRVRVFEPAARPQGWSDGAPQLAEMRNTKDNARFLYVGNTSPYKNLAVLQRAMEHLGRRQIDARLFATIDRTHALAKLENVEPLGLLAPDVLGEAYRLATALVMPSLVETVGLPMIEAMAAGTPVVAADRPYAREVCQDAALYFDPHDHEQLAERLEAIDADRLIRQRLSEAARDITVNRSLKRGDEALVSWLVAFAGRGSQ